MGSYMPSYKTRGDLKKLEGVFQQAKSRAMNLQKPIRVIVNCTGSGTGCFTKVQTAIYNNGQAESWSSNAKDKIYLDEQVRIVKSINGDGHDGQVSYSDIYWAIFMPDGRIFSDPRNDDVGFDIFVYYQQTGNPKNGWRLTVGKETGRVMVHSNQTKVVS
jgi:hypothetical protein